MKTNSARDASRERSPDAVVDDRDRLKLVLAVELDHLACACRPRSTGCAPPGRPDSGTSTYRGRRRGSTAGTGDVSERNIAACPAALPPPTTSVRFAGAELRLGLGGGVVDAAALELLESRHVRAPILSTGGDDQRAAGGQVRRSRARPRAARARCAAPPPAPGWSGGRRTWRPASLPAQSARCLRPPPGSPCSSRSCSTSRPGRRRRRPPPPGRRGPPMRRREKPKCRPARRRRRRRRRAPAAPSASRARAPCPARRCSGFAGSRRRWRSPPASRSRRRQGRDSSPSASSSVSRSIHM